MTSVNNQNPATPSGVAIIQCSGDTTTSEHFSKISTLNTNSTLGSGGGRKRRLLHRFKRRAPARDLWSTPTVLKIGSDSGSIRSSDTWRMRLPSLPSQPCSTISTVKSGRTLCYEDLEAAYAAANAQYRSVVDVESTATNSELQAFKSVVTVEEGNSPPSVPHNINVIVHNAAEEIPMADSVGHEVTRISVESLSSVEDSKSESSQPRRASSSSPLNATLELDGPGSPDNSGIPAVFLSPPQFLPHHLGPLPPLLLGARPPWNPGFTEAATPPIELTRWRLNHSFDPNPGDSDPERGRIPRSQRHAEIPRDLAGNVLHPEDLPRMFPQHLVPPPFGRFDEEMAEDEELKGCCGSFSRSSHATLVRWFIGIISMIGMACVVVGIVLGALTVSGTTRLTLCLLMIGVGAVLITVSGVAWRLTAINLSSRTSCWNIFGIRRPASRNSLYGNGGWRNPYLRVRSPLGRAMHPFAGFLYPEFAWRPPPPSYQASVREAQLQQFFEIPQPQTRVCGEPGSPPPTYRPASGEQRGSLDGVISEMSGPPSYRSHESIPGVVVEERPFSRQDPQRDTEAILVDDTQRLLAHHNRGINRENTNDGPVGQSLNGEFVSVIDCSTAVPIGFQVSERGEENERTEESSERTPRKRPRNGGFQYRGSLPPPNGNRHHGFFLVGGPSTHSELSRIHHFQRPPTHSPEFDVGPSYV